MIRVYGISYTGQSATTALRIGWYRLLCDGPLTDGELDRSLQRQREIDTELTSAPVPIAVWEMEAGT